MGQLFQPPFASRDERIAYNESWARDMNRARAEWRTAEARTGFRCECQQLDCEQRIELDPDEWAHVRSRANRFVVAPGHTTQEDVETVVSKTERYWIVDKHGDAGSIAKKLA